MCDPATLFRETERTARRSHRCDECRGTIAPGERYWDARGLWDGGWSRSAFCLPCRAAQRALWPLLRAAGEDCIEVGEMWRTAVEVVPVRPLVAVGDVDPRGFGWAMGREYGRALDTEWFTWPADKGPAARRGVPLDFTTEAA